MEWIDFGRRNYNHTNGNLFNFSIPGLGSPNEVKLRKPAAPEERRSQSQLGVGRFRRSNANSKRLTHSCSTLLEGTESMDQR